MGSIYDPIVMINVLICFGVRIGGPKGAAFFLHWGVILTRVGVGFGLHSSSRKSDFARARVKRPTETGAAPTHFD